ncbi:3-deoxy-manno-octulosonate cytidylyltransferase [Halobacteriovorax sp. HLS]|uniref:3-deoxy-manno-octulosonate cytidylyltransferase n=1 Tax=Halobacteriovorax sp. HLS TaxID=2234000 RepID=UPI000FDACDEF|nr:3-deoxy-manno-octulosonate cytidylyltransferase [Halobacteriovorax sp. HLS]
MKIIGVIPARLGSSRFPNKPLKLISQIPMIEHVRRRALRVPSLSEVYVATCDKEIFDLVVSNGGKAIMTSSEHERCTDRVHEAIQELNADIIVMIQGDEPLFLPKTIESLLIPLKENLSLGVSNVIHPVSNPEELNDQNVVKVVINKKEQMLLLSRACIPSKKYNPDFTYYKQTGLMAFTKKFLSDYSSLEPTPLEIQESIDMLRVLEHSRPLQAVIIEGDTIGVDTPADIDKVESILNTDKQQNELFKAINN